MNVYPPTIFKPAGTPVSQCIVAVKLVDSVIRITPPEKREDFRMVMLSLGYRWNRNDYRYCFKEPDHHLVPDRMAEVTTKLVGAGFLVSLHNPQAIAKARSGDFTPWESRWVELSGEWLRLVWHRPDDFYEAARSLPRSRYHNHAVEVPLAALESVVEFAEKYGFALRGEVKHEWNVQRTALANAVVLEHASAPEPGIVAKAPRPGRIHPLPAAPAEPDPELCDD